MSGSAATSRRRRSRRVLALGAVGAMLVAALVATGALADTTSPSSSLRTAVVKTGDVSQVLQRSGTIEPVAQATVAFPISGTISIVGVQPGDNVSSGQTLATLDTAALQSDLASRQAALAATQLTLDQALKSVAVSSTPTSTTSTLPSSSQTGSEAPSALQSASQQVVTTKQQVDQALSEANAALRAATQACASTSPSTDCFTAQQNGLTALQAASEAEGNLAQAESAFQAQLSSASSSASVSSASS